jgi:hypothetical protein
MIAGLLWRMPSKESCMTESSANHSAPVGARLASRTPSSPSRRPLTWAWRAIERFASARTADELDTLADRYQAGQPALAAEFRSAAFAAHARCA